MLTPYSEAHERDMIRLYESLNEKDKRRYAAVEAKKVGYGGIDYICCLFGCDDKTVRKGINDLQDEEAMSRDSIRQCGGGRKKLVENIQNINQAFIDILSNHTAGDPMNTDIRWTDLSRAEIAKRLKKRL